MRSRSGARRGVMIQAAWDLGRDLKHRGRVGQWAMTPAAIVQYVSIYCSCDGAGPPL